MVTRRPYEIRASDLPLVRILIISDSPKYVLTFESPAIMTGPTDNLLPLGDFLPSDRWQTHVNAIFYGTIGSDIHDHFQTYVSRDYRLAYSLAKEFFIKATVSGEIDKTLFVLEWGVGNGNLASSFLDRLKRD